MSEPLNVMIVDDSMSMRYVASIIATNLGHEVVGEAINGKEAVRMYAELKPDVVLLDLVMPRLDGKKTLRKLIEQDEHANVIICSSLGAEQDIEYCLRAGARSYLQKPYDAEAIKTALKPIVDNVLPVE